MPERPLLIFPNYTELSRTNRPPGRGGLHKPSKHAQVERYNRRITNLSRVLEAKSAQLLNVATGIIPEMVLVLETAGEIDEFYKAVANTPGMEFLLENQYDGEPTEDFYLIDPFTGARKGGVVDSRLYLTMSNDRALRELVSYWNEYKKDKKDQDFRRGTTKFRTLFEQLRNIRPYNVEDRIRDTGFAELIQERLHEGEEVVRFEIELALHKSEERNIQIIDNLRELISASGGTLMEQSLTKIEAINYHGIIAEAPIEIFDNLTEQTDVLFLKFEQILYIRPVGQSIDRGVLSEQDPIIEAPLDALPNGSAYVALLDGLPLANHTHLTDRLIIDDPDDYSRNYIAESRIHGTSMASLIIWGELGTGNSAISRPLYSRPIMFPIDGFECLPEDRLFIDLINRSIRRMKIGEHGSPPTAPEVRLINLSIGDVGRTFLSNISTWAKLLDWLAFEYDILFIVSAGNYKDEIQFNISRQAFEDLDSGQLESTTLRNIVENNYSRKIIAPSESINALTIGACHSDSTTPNLNNSRKNLVQDSQTISPISRVGFGYKRSIKPDVLMPGGRALYRLHPIGPNATLRLENNSDNTEPGIKCACPGTAGEINKTNFSKGTSISTALATRLGSRLLDILDVLGADDPNLSSSYYTVLVKALIVHGSRWNSSSFEALSQSLTGVHGRYSKRNIFPYLGYGTVNESKILFCTDQRVTILGFGTLKEGQAHEFNFPLPNELSGHMIDKTLTITMAYNSPVNPNTRKYRKAHLYFDNVKNNELIDFDRIIYDFNASSAGTVQHDVLHGNKADAYLDNQYIKVKVNCREDSAKLIEEIKYGLCVTFEIQENVGISIYNGVRDRITQQIRPRV